MGHPFGLQPAPSCGPSDSLPLGLPGSRQGGKLPEAGGATANPAASSAPLKQNGSSAGKEVASASRVGRVTRGAGRCALSGTGQGGERAAGGPPGETRLGFLRHVSRGGRTLLRACVAKMAVLTPSLGTASRRAVESSERQGDGGPGGSEAFGRWPSASPLTPTCAFLLSCRLPVLIFCKYF